MPSGIYDKSKAELQEILHALGIDNSGTLDDLRRRLKKYREQEKPTGFEPKSTSTPAEGTGGQIGTMASETSGPSATMSGGRDIAAILSQIRKWGCVFDGREPLAFLERLDELSQGYGFSGEDLLHGLPELLKGDSLLWYRINRHNWLTWNDFQQDFRQHYLPHRFEEKCRRDAQNRVQGPDESYACYEVALLTLLRRSGEMRPGELLYWAYENMQPEYQLYIRFEEVRDLADLRRRAQSLEAALTKCRNPVGSVRRGTEERRSMAAVESPTKPSAAYRPAEAAARYDKATHCWRCKQRGHDRHQCRQPAKRFCSQCGKDGVLTRNCHPASGNATRIEIPQAAPRS